MSTVEMKIRLDSTTRDKVNEVASKLGMTANTAFAVFAKQFAARGGFPFDVVVPEERVPTREAFIDEMERRYAEMKQGRCVVHDLLED